MKNNFTSYTLNEIPVELSWTKNVLAKKEVILKEYNQYKTTISTAHVELHQIVNQMLNSAIFNMIGTPIYANPRESVLENQSRLFCPRLFTPYEKTYIKYKKLADKYNLDSVPRQDLSYMFQESLSIIKNEAPIEKILRSDIVECKPNLDLIEHTHVQRMGVMFLLTDTEEPIDIIVEDRTIHMNRDEPVVVFDTSCVHRGKVEGKTNRVLLEIVLDFD